MKCLLRAYLALIAVVLSATLSFAADEPKREAKPAEGSRKPSEAAPAGERKPTERKPDAVNPRGEGKPRDEKPRYGGGQRSEFPAVIKLTDDQQKKLTDLRVEMGGKIGELSKQRDAVLSDEQKTARGEVEKKLREGGMSRQEYADALSAALKLTPEQQTKLDAVEADANTLRKEIDTKRMAILTDEQRTAYQKLVTEQQAARMFSFPADIKLTDEQQQGVKKLQTELGAEYVELTAKRDAILTEARRTARDAAQKKATEDKLDRQAAADAINAALNLSDDEKTTLSETQQKLGELQRTINERRLALLTPEQKKEFETKYGAGRGR